MGISFLGLGRCDHQDQNDNNATDSTQQVFLFETIFLCMLMMQFNSCIIVLSFLFECFDYRKVRLETRLEMQHKYHSQMHLVQSTTYNLIHNQLNMCFVCIQHFVCVCI